MFIGASKSFHCRGFFVSERFVSGLAPIRLSRTYYLARNRLRYPFRRELRNFGSTVVASEVIQSSCLQHWFKNWHEKRRNKLTASTFGGAVGFWPRRRVQLWLEKIGSIEPFSGNLATCWSNIKEEEALEEYKLVISRYLSEDIPITRHIVSFPEFQLYGRENPEYDFIAGSPDGVVDQIVYGLPSRGVLEIKCPFYDGDKQRSYPWSRIPIYCMPQAQGLMEILDRDWMDLYVWTLNGSSLFRINRNREYWDLMKVALSDFWWKHVQPAKEICRTSIVTKPLVQLKPLKPEPRHVLCKDIVYASKCLVDDSQRLMRELDENTIMIHKKSILRGNRRYY